jgi:pimeloyl-ACP methyl ester carboxylesterase
MVCAQEEVPRFEPASCPFEGAEGRDDIECGYLVVAENRDEPDGRTLRLAVSILKSLSDKPLTDPLVYLSGGPGGPSVKYSMFRLGSPFWTPFREERDLIFFDQRGTGYSQPVFCEEMNFAIQSIPFRGLSANEEQAMIVESVEKCREKMLAEGIDFGFYNTRTSALDLDDLREQLGYASWNLFGISYGTTLALAAMRYTPKGIRSVIIDSVSPPNSPLADDNKRLMRSLNLVFEQCEANAICKAAFPTMQQDFFSMLEDYELDPVTLELGDPERFPDGRMVVTGNLLTSGIFQGLYDPDFIEIFPMLVREVGQRNESLLAALADGLVKEPGFSSGLQLAVDCYERIPRITPEMIRADQSNHPQLEVWRFSANSHAICNALHQQRADDSWHLPVYSDTPTLVAAGEFDPITPPSYAKLAASTLSNSTYLEVPAAGHAAIPYGECAENIMASFLSDPAQTLDTSCTAEISPARFITDAYMSPGVYRIAKLLQGDLVNTRVVSLGLIVLLMISAIIFWPGAWLVRIFRKRQNRMPALASKARWLSAITSLLCLGFLLGLLLTVVQTAQDNPFLLGFGVPGKASSLFVLPWLATLGTIVLVVFTAIAWKNRWWSMTGRVYYSLVNFACFGFVVWVTSLGLI